MLGAPSASDRSSDRWSCEKQGESGVNQAFIVQGGYPPAMLSDSDGDEDKEGDAIIHLNMNAPLRGWKAPPKGVKKFRRGLEVKQRTVREIVSSILGNGRQKDTNTVKKQQQQRAAGGGPCDNCGMNSSCQWRAGPDGMTLCNPCGLKWSRKGQL